MNALANDVEAMSDEQRKAIVFRLHATSELQPEWKPTDHILKRWAASVGDGTPDYDEVVLASKVTALPDCVAILVDQLVIRSTFRKLVERWYRSPVSVDVIADELRMDVNMVRPTWRASLRYFRVYFETSPLSDLRKLAWIDLRQRERYVHGALRRLEASVLEHGTDGKT